MPDQGPGPGEAQLDTEMCWIMRLLSGTGYSRMGWKHTKKTRREGERTEGPSRRLFLLTSGILFLLLYRGKKAMLSGKNPCDFTLK
ncbi:Uncharacterized protein DAT39_005671 [Clarias magur]|uniref:Uncharacterized protein n=1 Tax=Clarias magur TaxID=1594786 RepID=A0A8J4UUY5_CLAMG|nr:Uncharacterized protein DAT39_005671 [Clarias magur]